MPDFNMAVPMVIHVRGQVSFGLGFGGAIQIMALKKSL